MNVLIFKLQTKGVTPAVLRVHACDNENDLVENAIMLNPEYIIVHSDHAEVVLGTCSSLQEELQAQIIVVCPISTPQVIREWTSRGAAMAWHELNWEEQLYNLMDPLVNTPDTATQNVSEYVQGMSQIITVGSTYSGAGSTHTAFLIASFLSRYCRAKVALIERGSHASFHKLDECYHGQKNSARTRFDINKVTLFKAIGSAEWVDSIADDFPFVVVDMGDVEEIEEVQTFFRSSLPVLVASSSDWRLRDLGDFMNRNRSFRQDRMRIACPLGTKEAIDSLRKMMKNRMFFSVPQHDNPFESQEDTDEVMESILSPLLPKKGKSGLSRLFSR
ncbi:hypothetical protein ACIFOE_05005 [Paenibacillus sp. NRS-1783]|uniref:hypothetical protein n=1 Tax=Paenibacillus sp. NRS-1783 TaxID=3233907 RepID=UPI003D2C7BFA